MNSIARRVVGLGLICAAAVAATAFEGRMTVVMKSSKDRNKEMVMNYALKEGFMRVEMQLEEARGTATILDMAKQEMIMLMPEQQMYMTMSLKRPAEEAAKTQHAPAKVEKTGKTQKILGYLCEQYIATDETGTKTEMWVTDQLGTYMGMGAGGGGHGGRHGGPPASQAWEELAKGKKGFFPLRVISHDPSGKESFTMETRKIEPGKLDDSLFAPPADYKKFEMPDMGGLGGLRNLNPFKHN